MNNKGQTLVIFVIILPVICMGLAFIIDTSLVLYETTKLDNINKTTIKYYFQKDENRTKEKIEELIKKNDEDIEKIEIILEENTIEITTKKIIRSIFGQLIGKKEYQVTSSYKGTKEGTTIHIQNTKKEGSSYGKS